MASYDSRTRLEDMRLEDEVINLRLAISKLGLILSTFQMMALLVGLFTRHAGVTPAGEHHHHGDAFGGHDCPHHKTKLSKPLPSILYMGLSICVSTLTWWAVGAPFAFGHGGENSNWMVGLRGWLLEFQKQPCSEYDLIPDPMCSLARWFHEWATAMFVVTIFASVVAGRCSATGFFTLMVAMAGGIYPIVAHWLWSQEGLLSPFYDSQHSWGNYQRGVMDVTGSGVIHITAGAASLMAILILRSPYGKKQNGDEAETGEIEEQSPDTAREQFAAGPSGKSGLDAEQLEVESGSRPHHDIGMLFMWFGWFGLTCGRLLIQHSSYEAIARGCVNLTLSATAAGFISFMIWAGHISLPEFIRGSVKRGDARTATGAGILAGLVTISACAATCEPYAAAIIGACGGFICAVTRSFVPRYHDPTDALSVHLFPGILGLIAAGLAATKTYTKEANYALGMKYGAIPGGGGDLLVTNLVGCCAILAWSLTASGTLCLIIRALEEGSRITRERWQGSTFRKNILMWRSARAASHDEEQGEESPIATLAPGVEPPVTSSGEPVMSPHA